MQAADLLLNYPNERDNLEGVQPVPCLLGLESVEGWRYSNGGY